MGDYPTDKELRQIEKWDFKDPHGLVDFIEAIWHVPEFGFNKRRNKLMLHTGGWSGNESIIAALEKNLFWSLYWQKSERGGHYWFKIKVYR